MANLPLRSSAGAHSEDERSDKAKDRDDFIRRFFGVAISVGYAVAIREILSDSQNGPKSFEAIFLVGFSMIVIIGSWEFYFRAIRKNPLEDWPRFALDVAIVTLYIVLQNRTTKGISEFSFWLSMIFICYAFWDILSIRAKPSKYEIDKFGFFSVLWVYFVPIWRRSGAEAPLGPAITSVWLIVFFVFAVFCRWSPNSFISLALPMVVAYLCYRHDQTDHWPIRRRTGWIFLIACLAVGLGYAEQAALSHLGEIKWYRI